jgi:hypothetical protein
MNHVWTAASLTFAALAVPRTAIAQGAPPPACNGPEHRQFDFWVGRWDVYRTGDTVLRAHSLIESLHGGCVIRERWMPLQGEGGGSLNHYDRSEGRWHQSWMDSSNGHVTFAGGLVGGKMVLTGFWEDANGPGKHGLVRMTYSRLDGGSVRQFGEISTDHGVSWSPFFDFTYRRAAAAK